eukprot:TRINITY_DN50967_c0_g1_i1.p1 TRINITY_DN50967_c0_g1~~TRINITY_DN50967_c0_g1_i1.p1  ORF type:complete len:122 (-),score=37.69 TRINITY_DN50967_c0_g1_i1:25-390(-)
MIRRPPRSTLSSSSAASDVYKRQVKREALNTTDLLGDRVLNLKTGVHLHEVELTRISVEDELNSSSTNVANCFCSLDSNIANLPVSYTHLRAHETPEHLVCRLLLEKKKHQKKEEINLSTQ